MFNSKKILSLALAIVMVMSMLSISAFAVKTTPTATFTVEASADEVESGDTVTITVKANATEDFYAGPMSIPVTFDSELFELVSDSVVISDVYGATGTAKVSKATDGKLVVALSPKTAGSVTAPNLNGANLTVFSFQLTAVAESGTDTIAIDAADQKTTDNTTGMFYCGSFDGTNPKADELTEMGQTLNTVDATVTIAGGETGTVELILTELGEESGTVIDRVTTCNDYDGYVYGIDTLNDGEDILDFVTTEAGSVEVEANENGEMSTGALIYLKDADDNIVETYVFVYFGDVTCDGLVDLDDSGAIEAKEAYIEDIEEGTAQFLAGDLTCDGMVDLDDSGAIEAQEAYIEFLPTQYELAQLYAENNL